MAKLRNHNINNKLSKRDDPIFIIFFEVSRFQKMPLSTIKLITSLITIIQILLLIVGTLDKGTFKLNKDSSVFGYPMI